MRAREVIASINAVPDQTQAKDIIVRKSWNVYVQDQRKGKKLKKKEIIRKSFGSISFSYLIIKKRTHKGEVSSSLNIYNKHSARIATHQPLDETQFHTTYVRYSVFTSITISSRIHCKEKCISSFDLSPKSP